MRSHPTDAEQRLWHQLRAHRIIEVDGGQHVDQMEYDDERTAGLESERFMVLRFWNHQVLQEIDGVLERIRQAVVETTTPSPLARVRLRRDQSSRERGGRRGLRQTLQGFLRLSPSISPKFCRCWSTRSA
ncbi:MAG: DUF559 domain-containing protein [Candidatus Competibacteraceae bacterium]